MRNKDDAHYDPLILQQMSEEEIYKKELEERRRKEEWWKKHPVRFFIRRWLDFSPIDY